MIDVRLLRSQPDAVREALARRAKPELLEHLDHALRLDTRLRDITAERDALRAKVNDISKQVGALRREKKDAEPLMAESRTLAELAPLAAMAALSKLIRVAMAAMVALVALAE